MSVSANDFSYSYECTIAGTTVTVDLLTEAALPTAPVALAEQIMVDQLLSPNEAGYFEEMDTTLTGFTYYGAFSQGSVSAVVVQTTDGDFVYANGSLLDLDGTADDSLEVTGVDNVSNYVLCFRSGTEISTPQGNRRVEDLRVGDLVNVVGKSPQEVRWIGRQFRVIDTTRRHTPVVIRAGALEDGVPSQDLYLSPDHAILIEGLLVTARSLVNNSSISWCDSIGEPIAYFHIELDAHELLIANNTLAESYLDEVPRSHFDNWQEWVELDREVMVGEGLPYLRVKSRRQLPEKLKSEVDKRIGVNGGLISGGVGGAGGTATGNGGANANQGAAGANY